MDAAVLQRPPVGRLIGSSKIRFILGLMAGVLMVPMVAWIFAYPWVGKTSAAIGHEIRDKRSSAVDFAQLTKFSWSEVLAFGPYQHRETICPALELSGFHCWRVVPAMVEESHYFLVFRLDGAIVHHEHHARINGDLYRSGQPQPLPRHRAVFDVVRGGTTSNGDVWYSLRYRSTF